MFLDFDWELHSEPVTRACDGQRVPLDCLAALIDQFIKRQSTWPDRSASDRWLAPRLHYALRLGRTEAADPDLWAWLGVRFLEYVEWRWSGRTDIPENRFRGPIHKQAFARLWWGAELFRNGADYSPVEMAFVFQDLPNSYLHRPIVRCRSLALALIDLVTAGDNADAQSPRTADDINDLARVLNLATAGAPPEIETDFKQDDFAGYQQWLHTEPATPDNWNVLPVGPRCTDTSPDSIAGGSIVAGRAWSYAHENASRIGARSAMRRMNPHGRHKRDSQTTSPFDGS